jgi:hypothetical protein
LALVDLALDLALFFFVALALNMHGFSLAHVVLALVPVRVLAFAVARTLTIVVALAVDLRVVGQARALALDQALVATRGRFISLWRQRNNQIIGGAAFIVDVGFIHRER